MTQTVENLDKELERLSGLVKDCRPDTHRWEVVWKRIDLLLEERGKLSLEVYYEHNNNSLRCDRIECFSTASGSALRIHYRV